MEDEILDYVKSNTKLGWHTTSGTVAWLKGRPEPEVAALMERMEADGLLRYKANPIGIKLYYAK